MDPAPHASRLRRSIGPAGACALVVGGVIGAGIYTLIGPIAAHSGGAVWLAFLIAMAVSVAGVVPVMHLAAALPRAGAGYFYASRLLGPAAGSVASAWILFGGACGGCVVALGLAQYLPHQAAPGGPYGLALLLVAGLYILYRFGVRVALGAQALMAAQMLLALLLYIVPGLAQGAPDLAWTSPAGDAVFFLAVVMAYNCAMGFAILAEMAEEIREPRRTIPFAIGAGAAIVGTVYIGVAVVFISAAPYSFEGYRSMTAPLLGTAETFLPPAAVVFVHLGAATAGLTSLNAAAMALPRELFAQARDGMLPAALGRIDRRTGSPLGAVTAFLAFMAALLAAGAALRLTLEDFSYLTVVGLQVATTAIGAGALAVAGRFPEAAASAPFRVPRPLLWASVAFTCCASAALVFLMSAEDPRVLVVYGIVTAAALVHHRRRTAWLRAQGVDPGLRLRSLPEAGSGIE